LKENLIICNTVITKMKVKL